MRSLLRRRLALRVRSKFLLVLAVLVPVIFALALAGISGLAKVRDDADELYSDHVLTIHLTQRVGNDTDDAYQLALQAAATEDEARQTRLRDGLAATIATVDTDIRRLRRVHRGSPPAERERVERLADRWRRFVQLTRSQAFDRTSTATGAAAEHAKDVLALKVVNAAEPVTELVDGMIATELLQAKAARDSARATYSSSRSTMLGLALLAVLAGFVTIVWLIRDIVPRTRDYSRFASRVASGEASERITPRGSDELAELGRTLNEMVEHSEAERAYVETQAEFAAAMQVTEDEHESHELLKHHIERSIADSDVVVLNRNNSHDRLEPTTPVAPDSPLADAFGAAEPRSCLAVRFGRTHEAGGERTPLLECELCGKRESARSTCEPLLVSGEVMGSVLVQHARPLAEADRVRIKNSVIQAAPVLANLRNLAIAEMRAATDALTGLPNNRALQDGLKRMVAHALRAPHGLGVILLDLDHFKQINDTYGHGKGDEALAAVGATLQTTIRESDFAGRWGGEEFLILLTEVDRAGAMLAAEKIRQAVASISIVDVERPITASLGVAVLPGDGDDPTTLTRNADRALYAAKAAGRNRVEMFTAQSTNGTALEPTQIDQPVPGEG